MAQNQVQVGESPTGSPHSTGAILDADHSVIATAFEYGRSPVKTLISQQSLREQLFFSRFILYHHAPIQTPFSTDTSAVPPRTLDMAHMRIA